MSEKIERSEHETDLLFLIESLVKLLWRHWWCPVVLALVFGAFNYGYTYKTYVPMYCSKVSATVMVATNPRGDSYGFYYDSSAANQLANTFPYILSSPILLDELKAELGSEVIQGNLAVSLVEGSNMLTMSVTSPDPVEAERILQALLRVYPNVARVVIGDIEFHLIDTPAVPNEPCNFPNYPKAVALGAVLGAVVGVAVLFLVALLHKRIHSPDELKPVSNIVCLGKISALRKRKWRHPSILEEEMSLGFVDEIDSLTLSVRRELDEIQGKVVVVTSTVATEGKSMVAENLAYALAKQGKRVTLIDGDLRKQDMWTKVGGSGKYGLMDVVLEQEGQQRTLEVCEKSGISFVGGKTPVPTVAEILNSDQLNQWLEPLRGTMDYIIIDSPPMQLFEDAAVLSGYADGVLYVVRHDWIRRNQIMETLDQLAEVHTKILGFVYNGQPHSHSRYGYGYGYGYGKYGYSYGRYGNR